MKRARQLLRRCGRPPLGEPLLYRRPMAVADIRSGSRCHGAPAYPVCPRCEKTMEREYIAFCSRCGQKLDWENFQEARIVYVEPHDILEDPVTVR